MEADGTYHIIDQSEFAVECDYSEMHYKEQIVLGSALGKVFNLHTEELECKQLMPIEI